MPAAVQLSGVSAGRDIQIEKILSIGAFYNIPAAPPAFSYRGIAGVPPPTDQNLIQQRRRLVEDIYAKLKQPGINALTLTGMGGIGKSTLAALLYQYVQAQLSGGNDFFQASPMWLCIDRAATFADVIGTVFQRLGKPLPVLDNLSSAGQVEALFTLLDRLALPRLIVLDQLDNLLDWDTGKALPTQLGVGELIDALNSRPWKSSCRLLLTSRPAPKGTRETPATCLYDYPIDEGLTQQEGLALFRSRGIQASEADIRKAVAFCDGHPLSLVLSMALIHLYGLSLANLLAEPTLWIGDIATNLLDAVFRRLTEKQQAVLRALSVYRTAVPVAALRPFLMGSSPQQILLSLRSLLVQQLIQPAENGCYQVHAVVSRYVQTHFVEGDQQANQQALRTAHAMAAHYYLEQVQVNALPRERRRGVNDIQGIIEAIWQYTQAAQWQEAYALMKREYIFADLHRWGSNALLLELCELLLPPDKWQPERAELANIYHYLGEIYRSLGQAEVGVKEAEKALALYRQIKDRQGEGMALNSLGRIYNALWQKDRARECYKQALSIYEEREDRGGEAQVLNNLGRVYLDLYDPLNARTCFEKALSKSREVGDHDAEGRALHGLGMICHYFVETLKAQKYYEDGLKYYEEALSVLRREGDRVEEGKVLTDLGLLDGQMGRLEEAIRHSMQALAIHREVRGSGWEGMTLHNLGTFYFQLKNFPLSLACFLFAKDIFEKRLDKPLYDTAQAGVDALRTEMGEKQFVALLAQIEKIAAEQRG